MLLFVHLLLDRPLSVPFAHVFALPASALERDDIPWPDLIALPASALFDVAFHLLRFLLDVP